MTDGFVMREQVPPKKGEKKNEIFSAWGKKIQKLRKRRRRIVRVFVS